MFDTGEIWSVDTYLVDAFQRDAERRGAQKMGLPYMEDRFKFATHSFRILLARLGFDPPLKWVAGIEGVKGAGLYYPARPGHHFPVPIPQGTSLEDVIWQCGEMGDRDTAATALKPFFRKVFDVFGVERPEYLDDLSNPK